MEETKKKIRPVYKELKGLMGNAPTVGAYSHIPKPIENRFNALVEEVKKLTNDDKYSEYMLHPTEGINGNIVSVITYRSMLNALIMRLQGEFSIEEQDPFGGTPQNVMTQTSTQNQNVNIQMMVQLGFDLKTALEKAETPAEKSFIEAIKDKLETVKSYTDFMLLVLGLANQFGITPEKIMHLFKL